MNYQEVKVLIAIQARSTSKRFPGKIFEMIGKKTVLQHVIDAAKSAKHHIERTSKKIPMQCQIAILHPEGDRDIEIGYKASGALLVPGDENNVLSRFVKARDMTKADYIVRLTSDCPLLLDFIISKHIYVAVHNHYDYVSNVHEECRTIADGFDVEIMSSRALDWLNMEVKEAYDKEHVTTYIRKSMRMPWFPLLCAFIPSKHDTSALKLSLDTEEDLELIRGYYHNKEFKMNLAKSLFGMDNVYEL